MLSGDPVVVKEESDDDHQPPAVNVEPPADDHGDDENTEDLAGQMSTIWRPNLGRLYASVAEMEGSESEDEENDATKKVWRLFGKRVRRVWNLPLPRMGHASTVAVRSRCICVHAVSVQGVLRARHGRRRYRCKECKK